MEKIVVNRLPSRPLVFRDNSNWLRYVLLGCAAGMCALVLNALMGAERDIGKIIGGTLGALLLGFSGYVLQVRRLVVDPLRREITVISKELTSTVTDRFRFDDVIKLQLLLTYERNEELLPANRQVGCWSVLFVLKERAVPLTVNPYASKNQAMREAKRIQQILHVEISDNFQEGIAHLAQAGRKIDAVAVARQHLDMPLKQAKDYIDQAASRRDS